MTRHLHPQDKPVRCTEIGPTTCLRQAGRSGKPEGWISGFLFSHDTEPGKPRCEGFVCIDPEVAVTNDQGQLKLWTMTGSLADGTLTLSPSIECTTHREWHAFVRDGRWTG